MHANEPHFFELETSNVRLQIHNYLCDLCSLCYIR